MGGAQASGVQGHHPDRHEGPRQLQGAAALRRIGVAASVAALAVGIMALGAPGSLAKATKPKVVKVLDDFYKPDSVRVRKRGKVKWDWGHDFDIHNVTLKKGPKG